MEQILLLADVHTHDEGGEVTIDDMIATLESMVVDLKKMKEDQPPNTELFAQDSFSGSTAPNRRFHAKVLVGSSDALAGINSLLGMMAAMGEMNSSGELKNAAKLADEMMKHAVGDTSANKKVRYTQ